MTTQCRLSKFSSIGAKGAGLSYLHLVRVKRDYQIGISHVLSAEVLPTTCLRRVFTTLFARFCSIDAKWGCLSCWCLVDVGAFSCHFTRFCSIASKGAGLSYLHLVRVKSGYQSGRILTYLSAEVLSDRCIRPVFFIILCTILFNWRQRDRSVILVHCWLRSVFTSFCTFCSIGTRGVALS